MASKVDSADGAGAVFVAWLARLATFVFLIYYTALDAIGGFGLARTILIVKNTKLSQEQLTAVIALIDATWQDSWVGGVGSFVSLTGSWAAFAAALLTAIALLLTRRVFWLPLLILVGFGWELQMSHTMPHGPIAFSLLIVAALWIKLGERRSALKAKMA